METSTRFPLIEISKRSQKREFIREFHTLLRFSVIRTDESVPLKGKNRASLLVRSAERCSGAHAIQNFPLHLFYAVGVRLRLEDLIGLRDVAIRAIFFEE